MFRFNQQHRLLVNFYYECSNLRYLTSLISVPRLPQVPPLNTFPEIRTHPMYLRMRHSLLLCPRDQGKKSVERRPQHLLLEQPRPNLNQFQTSGQTNKLKSRENMSKRSFSFSSNVKQRFKGNRYWQCNSSVSSRRNKGCKPNSNALHRNSYFEISTPAKLRVDWLNWNERSSICEANMIKTSCC
jgi:hypothetical protein